MTIPPAPQSSSAHPAHPVPPYGGSPAAAGRRGNPAGLVAAILVAAVLAVQLIGTFVSASVFASPDVDFSLYGVITSVFSVLQGVIALAAIILGAIGLAARGRPKALAGIGVGGGAVTLFGILTGYLTNALLFAFSS